MSTRLPALPVAAVAVCLQFGVAVIGTTVAMLVSLGDGVPAAWHAGAATVPGIVCSVQDAGMATSRPTSVVTVLRSEALDGLPGKRITTLLVRFAPRAVTPRHMHGGPVTAYVISGHVRSQLGGGPVAAYGPGEVFHEPMGAVHTLIENPSADEPAELLATIVHDEGAQLTTFLD